jgi:hypothetical protein
MFADNTHFPTGAIIFDRVRNQIEQHLLESLAVGERPVVATDIGMKIYL